MTYIKVETNELKYKQRKLYIYIYIYIYLYTHTHTHPYLREKGKEKKTTVQIYNIKCKRYLIPDIRLNKWEVSHASRDVNKF